MTILANFSLPGEKAAGHLAYSNTVVAGSAAAVYPPIRFPHVPASYALMVFFATLAAYGYMHLSGSFGGGTKAEHPVLAYTARHSFFLQLISGISALLALGLLVGIHLHSALWLLPALVSSALYPSTRFWRKGLRSYPRLKLPLIALNWSWVCAFVPLYKPMYCSDSSSHAVCSSFLDRLWLLLLISATLSLTIPVFRPVPKGPFGRLWLAQLCNSSLLPAPDRALAVLLLWKLCVLCSCPGF